MKVRCDPASLAQALAKVMKMVPKGRAAMTVFLSLVASAIGTLNLLVSRNGTTLAANLVADVELPGRVSLLPAPLADLAHSLADRGLPVTVEHSQDGEPLEVLCGSAVQKLTTAPDEEASDALTANEDCAAEIRISVGTLRLALDRLGPVLASAADLGSIDETALDVDDDNRVTLVATDSCRLAIVGVQEARLLSLAPCRRSWSLRIADVQLLTSLLNGGTASSEELTLKVFTGEWTAAWGPYRLTAPLSDKMFPNWRAIRPKSYTNELEADGREFGAILRLLAKVADKKSAPVRFHWNGQTEATLSAGSRAAGTETTMALALEWKARVAAPGSELVLSAKLLEPLVKRLEPGPVRFCFTLPASPAMVRSAGEGEGLEYLVMPINQ